MKTAFNRFAALILLAVVSFTGVAPVMAGPNVVNLSETNLADSSSSPFHLNTDRFKTAFQSISTYLTAHEELSASTILIADDHGHFLRGVVSDWSYYTYGTHKGIELYVFNPEDGSQFLTVEIWLPKEQQRNVEKKDSYLSSFQQIESLLSGSNKYRLDLVFQDEVQLAWGNGYAFKLDDEGTSLSFTFMNGAHPKMKTREVKEKVMTAPVSTPVMKATATVQATASVTASVTASASTTPTTTHKKKKKSSSASVTPTVVAATPTVSDDAR